GMSTKKSGQIGTRWPRDRSVGDCCALQVTNLNSNVTPGVSQTVTEGIYGGLQKIVGVNLSWYPKDWLRFYLQFQYVNVDKLNSAGTTQIGQQFETLAGRVQIAF